MASKALTDCPENLREAIDWLIQVDHCGGIPRLSAALGKLFDNVVQDAQKSLSSLPESHHTSAGDVISRLQTFQGSVQKNSANNNQNILHNLCSAFEKFLGYQPPGTYDGSGIVYGSASRLCDAVLSFLHKVISDVYENQPYVAGRGLLDNVVSDLEKARWTGHHGFKTVVPEVARGLGEYNKNVKASNDKVKRPISDMIDYVKDEGGELLTKIRKLNETDPSDPDVKAAEELAKECVGKGKDFGKAFTLKSHPYYMKGEFDDLNASLRDKIHNARTNVGRETAILNRWSRKQLDNYNTMVKLIKQAFRKLKYSINSRIRKEVTDLVDSLKGLVRNILAKLENVSKTLASYVVKLETWMEESQEFIDKVLVKADEILAEINEDTESKLPNHKKHLDESIKTVESMLEKRVGELEIWKLAAAKVIQVTIANAKTVHTALNHEKQGEHDGTVIGKGVKQVNDAKDRVREVDELLKTVGSDLTNWKSAAHSVLGTAVSRAGEVHGKLDPKQTDDQHKIGKNIENIKASNEAIIKANLQLKKQVDTLHSWIDTAEGIRQKAEKKAKEAYEKLEVNKTLDLNVKKIIDAKKEIEKVHTELNGVHSELGKWNKEARTVLTGAIGKAEEIYNKLEEGSKEVGMKLVEITQANGEIERANTDLQNEVTALDNWKSAAKEVIGKADKKCDLILRKVQSDNVVQHTVIGENANNLKEKAENLLTAYSQAHPKVQQLLTDLPKAIIQLEAGMKEDLVSIRNSVVGNMKALVGGMLSEIQTHVKQIKGTAGKGDQNTGGKGLEGIVTGLINSYASGFSGEWPFQKIVEGWLEDILGKDKTGKSQKARKVEAWLNQYVTEKARLFGFSIVSFRERIDEQIKATLREKEIKPAGEAVKTGMEEANRHQNEKITKTIEAVREGCEKFVKGLDEIYGSPGIKELAEQILQGTIYGSTTKENLKLIIEPTLIALRATANQVGEEIKSILLADYRMGGNSSIAKELDKAVEATGMLHTKLGKAHAATSSDVPNDKQNTILENVKGIERQVKKGMKAEKGIAEDFEKIMEQYQAKKKEEPDGENGLYRKLTDQDIPQAMHPFQQHAELTGADVSGKKQAINSAFEKITQELQEIAKCVENKSAKTGNSDEYGIKQRLSDLDTMLEEEEINLKGKVDGITKDTVNGLDAIKTAIAKLQTTTFNTKPAAIGQTVQEIRKELQHLREKLMKEKGKDVIRSLEDLKRNGLGAHWAFDDARWNGTESLTAIQNRIKYQNKELGKQPAIIDDAIDAIRWELRIIGIRLNDESHDDIVDDLKRLARKIGQNADKDSVNLSKICEEIQRLKEDKFTYQPLEIRDANEAIKRELQRLRDALQGQPHQKDGVIYALRDLITVGLTESDKWQNGKKDAKGFDFINSELKRQQGILTKQPGAIGNGAQGITTELTRLRSQLVDHVTDKLQKLKDHGLSDGNGKWTAEDKESKGLPQITKDIYSIKTENVRDVKDYVRDLCAAIRRDCRELKEFLKWLKETLIGEQLRKIKDQIDRLRTEQLGAVIRECKAFIERDADVFKKRCIDELTKYVDQELDAEENKLLAEARLQYVSTVKEMLKSFAAKVETELGELPGEIDGDLRIGFKGLMSRLQGEFNEADKTLDDVNINLLKDLAAAPAESAEEKIMLFHKLATAFKKFWSPLAAYINREIVRVHEDNNEKRDPVAKIVHDYSAKLLKVYDAFNELLHHLKVNNAFDDRVPGMLDKLKEAFAELRPENFQKPSTPTIDTIRGGLQGFVAELGTAYVSAYSGTALDWRNAHNPDMQRCAKVFLSCLPILKRGVDELNDGLTGREQNWWDHKIHIGNKLGDFFASRGFKVSAAAGTQPAELQNSDDMKGKNVHGILTEMVQDADGEHLKKCSAIKQTDQNNYNFLDVLECLYTHLYEYYETCHLIVPPSLRTPCNVYEMLCWLTGLPHNCVYDKLRKCIKLCYDEQTKNSLYPTTVVADALVNAVDRLAADSPSVLTRVLGYGNAMTTYACDFYSNSLKLHYPQDGEHCLHRLLHCLRALLPLLRFLFSQCSLPLHHGGWAQCRYGKGVTPYTWQCNSPLNSLPSLHPECSDKSPLQSYLNDCLPGHLPHRVATIGCEPVCKTCPSGPDGTPCLTPLGFRGFSGSTNTGEQLCEVLTKLFANEHLSSLLSLQPRPPATLDEHFAFALSLVADWHDGKIVPNKGLQKALEASAADLSLRLSLTAAYGSDSAKHGGCKHPHLMHLAASDFCTRHQASPFLSTLCRGMYDSLAHRHSELYLSWAIYLPWKLWDYLETLRNAFQAISCRVWSCDGCLQEGPCDQGSHGVLNPKAPGSGCQCPSIVQCKGVLPTLYQYGFTFGDASALISQNKNCFSLRTQISQLLHSDHFRDLFDKCDEFLWRIRMPFFYTLVALWFVAFLLLAHTMLYRLDVLHIRSHLMRTKASHLIDAKALLTHGRKMLSLYNGVDYFDDEPIN
ncbi:hypothetical protein, conserved [Babesia ovata]|uniref:Extracellular matrix-binding ebh n=1 Tax=Babesia ovata TaxID=189622 RepID=A0A2H6K905_9APIC|nr:uncharacterized protein BOVATA_009700 [Babesia ovata]GBE59477.1 hypothetical protein, conserved [Babesia ovata]